MISDITIVIITYKSEKIINKFLNKIPSNIKTIIIENSQNHSLKKEIEKKYQNVNFYIKENNGVSSSLNFAVNQIDTKFFLQISPDIEFNFNDLKVFNEYAKKLENKFAALGPRFLNVNSKSHKQIDKNLEFGSINSVHGSCMFINKENFLKIGGFDDNFFLYFEETDYCNRGSKIKLKSYQINSIKVNSIGRSVHFTDKESQDKVSELLLWHFIWSKFYFYKKRYGWVIALIIFFPTILRTIFKLILLQLLHKKKKSLKYKIRLSGLLNSIVGNSSSKRL